MSTIKTTYIQHPSATSPNLELAADGTVVLPLSDLEDLANVSGSPTDGQVLEYDSATSEWGPATPSISGFDLTDLGDVSGTPTDGQILEYDSGTSSWGPASIALPAAIGSNVAQTVKTDVFQTNATGITSVSGMSVTITPTSASSRLLVIVSGLYATTAGGGTLASGLRLSDGTNTSPIATGTGSRFAATLGHNRGENGYFHSAWLYTPGTTSPVTITLQIMRQGETISTSAINRWVSDTDSTITGRGVSTITAIEVAA